MPYKDGNPTLGEQIEEDMRRKFYTDDIIAEARAAFKECDRLRAALTEISLGRGAFKMDPLEHAESCINDMKDVACRALDGEFDEDWGKL